MPGEVAKEAEPTVVEPVEVTKDLPKEADSTEEMQGLEKNGKEEKKTASPTKEGTMVATAKEGEAVLEAMGGAPESRTRSGDKDAEKKEKEETEEDVPAKKAKVEREGTMAATAAEGEALVAGEELGTTRAETAAIKEAADGEAEEEVPAVAKTHTMAETTKEAEELLEGEEKGGTRSETNAVKAAEEANGDA